MWMLWAPTLSLVTRRPSFACRSSKLLNGIVALIPAPSSIQSRAVLDMVASDRRGECDTQTGLWV